MQVKRENMTVRILLLSIVLFTFTAAIPFAVYPANDSLGCSGMTSLELSFVRKQWFQGQCRVSKGRFSYDGSTGRACYDYSGPYRYMFILCDTSIVGIDKRNNRGYALARNSAPRHYEGLYFSLDLFGQFLQSADAAKDLAAFTVRASIDSCVYYERKTVNGKEIIAIARETGRPSLVESFDENGMLIEQSRMAYNESRKAVAAVPSQVIVKKKWGDVVTVDSITCSSIRLNGTLAPERFAVPQACRLFAFGEMNKDALKDALQGALPPLEKGKQEKP
jgi:hypothetical protein